MANELTLRVAGIVPESTVDGPGIRYTIFVQGCTQHCPGCHNPQTWDPAGGTEMSVEDIFEQISKYPHGTLSGVTFSGGEPFLQARALATLALWCRLNYLTVWSWSGYTLEQLVQKAERGAGGSSPILGLLRMLDTLVDGPFKKELYDPDLQFRGSTNQRILGRKEIYDVIRRFQYCT